MKKRIKAILSVCLTLHLIIKGGAYAYVPDYYHADELALAAMAYQITGQIQIKQDGDVIWFVPEVPTAGLIFYPGDKVGPIAYAPLLRACVEKGEPLCAGSDVR